MQWIYQEEKVEHLEKYLTWFTPLVSSIAAIIFAAEEQIDKRGRKSFFIRVFYASKGSCTYYVITFGGPERPPPPCNIVIIWAYPPPM